LQPESSLTKILSSTQSSVDSDAESDSLKTCDDGKCVPVAYKACDNGKRLCVPYYLCDRDLENGSDLTVLSSESECEDYFEACCTPDKVLVINMF